MHHTFMQEHIPNPKFMVLAETFTFGVFRGRNVRGRNVQAEMSVAEMSVAEMSEHRTGCLAIVVDLGCKATKQTKSIKVAESNKCFFF